MTINRTQLSALRGRRGCLVGERGLFVAIIFQALHDYQSENAAHRQDAAAYFLGENYRRDLQLLGLPHCLPVGIDLALHSPDCRQ
jgi:hypothetical protein